MANGDHIEFRNMLISPYWMKTFCSKFFKNVQHDHAEMPMWPKMDTEVNSRDVISRTPGTKCRSFSAIIWEWDIKFGTELKNQNNHHGEMCQIHLSCKCKMAAAVILNIEKCQYFQTGWRYFHQIWWTGASQPSQVLW